MPLPSDRGADAASLPLAAGPSRRAGRQRHLVAAGGEPSSRFAAGAWRGGASAPAPPSPRETPSSGAPPSPWQRRALGLAAAPLYSPNPSPPPRHHSQDGDPRHSAWPLWLRPRQMSARLCCRGSAQRVRVCHTGRGTPGPENILSNFGEGAWVSPALARLSQPPALSMSRSRRRGRCVLRGPAVLQGA